MSIMLYIALFIILTSFIFYKQIHQYKFILYAIALIVVSLTTNHTPNIVNLGYVGISFFIVVLFSGLLDKGILRKRLFMVRAELAILGSILIFPHTYGYFEFYVNQLGLFGQTISFYIGLLAYLVMIPLTITSFQKIRKQFKYKNWKKLHKLSYIFFFLVGLHVILIANENMLVYSLLFGFYFLTKAVTVLQTSYQKKKKTILN